MIENPYASPTTASEARRDEDPTARLRRTASGLRLVRYAIAYHVTYFLLNQMSLYFEGSVFVVIAIVAVCMIIWLVSLVYHGWFAKQLYGLFWGIFLAPLAAFPIIGLMALAMFVRRARTNLRAAGWKVKWFIAIEPKGLQ